MNRVYEFLKNAKTYFLATVEGDQPRVRPFGSVAVFEDKLYLQTGKVKEVSKQMQKNPKIEICALIDTDWMRIQAEAVRDDRMEPKLHMFEVFPQLRQIGYSENDGNMEMLYLKNAIATIYTIKGTKEEIRFG